jgi:hypothetical protein
MGGDVVFDLFETAVRVDWVNDTPDERGHDAVDVVAGRRG